MAHLHRLVPEFILDNLAQGKDAGRFDGVGLFVDISGFTSLTETLMQHGPHGAEVLAAVVYACLEPLVRLVYEQGGFIATFAGDAFTALFPLDAREAPAAAYRRALAAGWRVQQHLQTHATHTTEYGAFVLQGKVGLAAGQVAWGILQSAGGAAADQAVAAGQTARAAYYFGGTAVSRAADAEQQALRGEVIVDETLAAALAADVVAVPTAGAFFRVTAVVSRLPAGRPVLLPAGRLDLLAHFYPRELLTQPARGEFRHIVTLFAGLPGRAGTRELQRVVQCVFDLQAQLGGLLSRVDFGDKGINLVFFWGVPVAYERDAARALRFALALLAQSGLPLRIGITRRIAHAGFSGSPLREEFTCMGRGVNLAARFMMGAPDGQIWVDERIAAQVQTQFELHAAGSRAFKGFDAAQPVFQLLAAKASAPPLFAGDMIGREAELRALQQVVQGVLQTGTAAAVLLWGEAGIGKSRLIHALLDQLLAAETPAVQLFLCQTDQILRQPLNPFRSWLRPYFQQSDTDDATGNRQRFDRQLDALLAVTRDAALRAMLQRTRSFLAALVDLYWAESSYAHMEPRGRFDNTLLGLTALLQAESLRQPVLLVLEDVHWLDAESEQFLAQLLRATVAAAAPVPLAIVATGRPEQAGAGFGAADGWQTVPLAPLSAESVVALTESVLGGPAAPPLLQLLAKRAEGNPFFAEQLLRYVQEAGLIQPSPDGWSVLASETAIPRDVQTMLVARLDRLGPRMKQAVQVAAVLGREFDVRLLARMLGGAASVPALLEQGALAAIWSELSERRCGFRHALLRDAAYEMQIHARRQTLHQLALEAYERLFAAELAPHYPELAYHAELAGQTSQARLYWQRAGDAAREAFQNSAALDFYTRALGLTPATAQGTRFDLLAARERVLHWLGSRDRQQADLAELTHLAGELGDQEKQLDVLLKQARYAEETGAYERALETAAAAVRLARQIENPLGWATGLHHIGLAHYWQGRYADAREQVQQALALYRDVANREGEMNAHYHLGLIADAQRAFAAGQAHKAAALAIVRDLADLQKEAMIQNSMGLAAAHQQAYAEAKVHLERAFELYQQIGNRRGEGVTWNNLGIIAHVLGHYARATEAYQRSLAIRREIGDRQGEVLTLANLGEVSYRQGEPAQACAYYERSLQLAREMGMRSSEVVTLQVYGDALLALGEQETAGEAYRQALALHDALEHGPMQRLPALLGLGRIALARGEQGNARDYLEAVLPGMLEQTLDGLGDPFALYWTAYEILKAWGDSRSGPLLQIAYDTLQSQAANMADADSQRAFLENVPEHRAIVREMMHGGRRDGGSRRAA